MQSSGLELANRSAAFDHFPEGNAQEGRGTSPRRPPANHRRPVANQPSTDLGSNADTSSDLGGDTSSTFDSAVGYIDNAIPGSQYRMRFDVANNSNRPTRAEYFYAKGGPFGPGLPKFETNVNYQILSNYLEGRLSPQFSVFIEEPVRFLNPQVNANHNGFGDINAGFKYAFIRDKDTVATFQLRTYAPTGNVNLGLGTGHVSLEPAFLFWRRLSDCLRMEGEFKYWIPIGGTDFAGDVTEYGLGFAYGRRPADDWWFNPVLEIVGWTVLGGKEQVGPTVDDIKGAAGDTIVNAKFGFRFGFGNRFNFYSGYGRALTGDVWYKSIWRTELRILF